MPWCRDLIDLITATVKPTSWDTVGGPGSLSAFEATGITVLVVSQTQDVQEAIEKLLADLRKAKHPGGDTCPPIRARPAKSPPAQGPCFMGGGQSQPPQSQPKPPAKPAAKI